MTVFTLILVFILNGSPVVMQKDFKTAEECNSAGQAIVDKQMLDPHFDQGLFAACVPNQKEKV
jgi:hypothetical protein